jgi:DNA-binding transcriptional MerR regulator
MIQAMKNHLSIKDFSKLSGIAASTLRYWDGIGLFSPSIRDPENKYRYYSPDQMIAANFVSVFSQLNTPLRMIGDVEKDRTPAKIVQLIAQQEKLLDSEMMRLRENHSIMHTRMDLINYGRNVTNGFTLVNGMQADSNNADEGIFIDETKVAVMHKEDMPLICGLRNEWESDEEFYRPFMCFCNYASALDINLGFPIGGIHDTWERFMAAPGKPDYFFSMDPAGGYSCPAGDYLTGFARGYYGELGDLSERMNRHAEKNALTISGPVYTMYLHDEITTRDTSRYLAQVCVAVE